MTTERNTQVEEKKVQIKFIVPFNDITTTNYNHTSNNNNKIETKNKTKKKGRRPRIFFMVKLLLLYHIRTLHKHINFNLSRHFSKIKFCISLICSIILNVIHIYIHTLSRLYPVPIYTYV